MNKQGVAADEDVVLEIRPSLQKKYNYLKKIILRAKRVALAFSGGVDSTFLLKVCHNVLNDDVLAVTATSETFPDRELKEAKELAHRISAQHIIIKTEELSLPGFTDNPPNRCFLCKNELFSKIKQIANAYGLDWVFDGSNADDVGDFRPGRKAAKKLGVRSPLEESGLGKKEIRILSRMLDLPTWNKPAYACLSSRFPYFSKITRPALKQVEKAETYIWECGIRKFRVRHHGSLARIEVGASELGLLDNDHIRNQLVQYFKSIGYTYITLDLEGFRSGSMNETLNSEHLTI